MDYETASCELVRALRGRRSQVACSRRLKHTSNVLHTWETGTRFPVAEDFLRLARLAGRDVEALLARFGGGQGKVEVPLASRTGFARWLVGLAELRSVSELARGVGRNRNTVARWLEGTTQPRLPDLLRYVELTSKRSLEFIAAFADAALLPSLGEALGDLEQQRKLAYDMPWAHAVLRAIELDAYQRLRSHRPGLIAEWIGVDPSVEAECLSALARAGQIRRVRGKWRVHRAITVDTRTDPEGNWRVKRHWAAVALQRLSERSSFEAGMYSYNLFAISEASLSRIKALHMNYFERLRAIVAECQDPTRVVLVNVQLCPLERPTTS